MIPPFKLKAYLQGCTPSVERGKVELTYKDEFDYIMKPIPDGCLAFVHPHPRSGHLIPWVVCDATSAYYYYQDGKWV